MSDEPHDERSYLARGMQPRASSDLSHHQSIPKSQSPASSLKTPRRTEGHLTPTKRTVSFDVLGPLGRLDLTMSRAQGVADERTAILRANSNDARSYATHAAIASSSRIDDTEGTTSRRSSAIPAGEQQTSTSAAAAQREVKKQGQMTSWWSDVVENYGSLELENKGSVARDHLALERTFLAWLRTSLSFASIGIAVTQLFRLNTSINGKPTQTQDHLKHVGRPLGATFIGIAIIILFIGFHRYFESQHYVIRGKFPASRGAIVFVALIAGAIIVASMVVVLAIAKGTFD